MTDQKEFSITSNSYVMSEYKEDNDIGMCLSISFDDKNIHMYIEYCTIIQEYNNTNDNNDVNENDDTNDDNYEQYPLVPLKYVQDYVLNKKMLINDANYMEPNVFMALLFPNFNRDINSYHNDLKTYENNDDHYSHVNYQMCLKNIKYFENLKNVVNENINESNFLILKNILLKYLDDLLNHVTIYKPRYER